jgi:GLPGLI family protein
MRLLIIILFHLQVSNLIAQNGYKVIYKLEPTYNIENYENVSKRVRDLVKKSIEYAKKEEYVLLTNKNNSHFSKSYKLHSDVDKNLSLTLSATTKLMGAFKDEVFVSFDLDSLKFKLSLSSRICNVKRKLYNFNWKIADESKLINGLLAIKATGKHYDIIRDKQFDLTAWFVPSIPISSGPDIYNGLPGLIVELHLRKLIIKMDSIEEINNITIKTLSSKNLMTNEEYEDLVIKGNKIIKSDY